MINAYVVVLEHDLHPDDSKRVVEALKLIKGVLTVTPNATEPLADMVAQQRAEHEFKMKVYEALR